MPIKWQPFFSVPILLSPRSLRLCCSFGCFCSFQYNIFARLLNSPIPNNIFHGCVSLSLSFSVCKCMRLYSEFFRINSTHISYITYVHGCWQYILYDVNTNANIIADSNPHEWWKHHCVLTVKPVVKTRKFKLLSCWRIRFKWLKFISGRTSGIYIKSFEISNQLIIHSFTLSSLPAHLARGFLFDTWTHTHTQMQTPSPIV